MSMLPAAGLLRLWEQAEGLPPVQRALALAAGAGGHAEALSSQPLGRTHACLLDLRGGLLGPTLAATAGCPACQAIVEFTLDGDVLRKQPTGPPAARVTAGGVVVDWRAPTPADLVGLASGPAPERVLRERCLTVTPDDARLTETLVHQVEQAMAVADPLAEVIAVLTCPDCGADFESDLDVGGFVWAEVDARAKRLLHEVDVLARAYGWTEGEVLALSEHRRATYLRIVLEGGP
jgi:hypothetical protein